MGMTAISGPLNVYGESSIEHNLDIGPSLFACGEAFVDVRSPFRYLTASNAKPKIHGFPQNSFIQAINATIYANADIATVVTATGGVPLVLNSTSVPGVTVGVNVHELTTNLIVEDLIAFDDFNTTVYNNVEVATSAFLTGPSGNIACWDPATLSSRRLTFNIGLGGVANTFYILGIDVYGYGVSETLVTTGAGAFFASKAYKYILRIIPSVNDPAGVTVSTSPNIGLPLRYDYPGTVLAFENGVANATPGLESSLYTITGITPLAGILTITIADALFGAGAPYTIPVGSIITIAFCVPTSYNGMYTVLTSGPGTFTVASAVADAYVSGGTIFCDRSGPHTSDVRGIYHVNASPDNDSQLILYQAVSLENMVSSVGQFGVLQVDEFVG